MQKQIFCEKVFSRKRLERYLNTHEGDLDKAMLHYQCNMEIAETFCPLIAVFEVALRNAINRELIALSGKEDWYAMLFSEPKLKGLGKEITQAEKRIRDRKETVSPDKIVAELTLGFWVSLFNEAYDNIFWSALRRAFPFMPKDKRKRRNVSRPLNSFRKFRNRVFHHEPICWSLGGVKEKHLEIVTLMGWINKDLPGWISPFDRFETVVTSIEKRLL